jgi:hypothetical protein
MLPYQRPPEREPRLSRREKIEWAIIIAAVLVWWPKIFLRESAIADDPFYSVLCYVVAPLALLFIFVRRVIVFRRYVEEEERKRDQAEERAKMEKSQRMKGKG